MKNKIAVIILFALLSACFKNSENREALNMTKPVENIHPAKDQVERRKKSEEYCNAHSIPLYKNPNSLFVESENEVTIRTKDEVVDRAFALLYIALKSEGLEQEHLDKLYSDYAIGPKLSPKEKSYAFAEQPTEQQKIDANWRYESLHVMLWALGYIDDLAYPDQFCDVAGDVKTIHDLTAEEFRSRAVLRTKKEILDQADLALRIDWACVNARINNEAAPGSLDAGVVFERHYSFNWLIKYLDQDWDDVRTDT